MRRLKLKYKLVHKGNWQMPLQKEDEPLHNAGFIFFFIHLNKKNIGNYSIFLCCIHVIYLFALAFYSNNPHAVFQVAAFYQIGRACFFHGTLTQLPSLLYLIDISPLGSPTFPIYKEFFNAYNTPYYTEINLINVPYFQ